MKSIVIEVVNWAAMTIAPNWASDTMMTADTLPWPTGRLE